MTTQLKKLDQPTHDLIKNSRALAAPSMVEFEQIKTIDKSRIKGYLGKRILVEKEKNVVFLGSYEFR